MARNKKRRSNRQPEAQGPSFVAEAAQAAPEAVEAAAPVAQAAATELPGSLRRTLRFTQAAMKGGKDNHPAVLQTLLEELSDSGMPEATIAKVKELGPKLLTSSEIPKSLKALAGSAENSKLLEHSIGMAQSAAKGLKKDEFQTAWDSVLTAIGQSDKEIAAKLRTIPLSKVREIGVTPLTGAIARNKDASWFGKVWSKVTKSQPVQMSEKLTAAVDQVAKGEGGALVSGAAKTAVKEAGLGGSVLGKLGGKLTGAGLGFGLNMLMPFGSASPVTLPFRAGRARDKAVQGFAAMGATSSSAYMGELVRQQEMAARRKMTLQTYDPEIYQQILMALADTGSKPSNLTQTERRIGDSMQEPLPARRPDKDVNFLLDQMMNELSGQH